MVLQYDAELCEAIADAVLRCRAGIKNRSRPVGAFLFIDSTGVGKTEHANGIGAVSSRRGNQSFRIRRRDCGIIWVMKILVCIKQVPGTTQVEIDETTGTLKRDGVQSKMNPFDLYAIETAVRIGKEAGAEVTAITMGPPQCERVVREAFMMGVDKGVIMSDRAFGGADVLMTSYTLAQGARRTGLYDIIVCGKQTTDGDTAQVGAEMAEWLGIPHVVNVKSIDGIAPDAMSITVDLPDCEVAERIPYPFLMTVEKGIFEPRLPSYKLMKATADREITWLSLKDLGDSDPKHYGLNGSPTQVKRIFPPESHVERIALDGDDTEKAARLADILADRKFL